MARRALLRITDTTGGSRLYKTHSGSPESLLPYLATWLIGRGLTTCEETGAALAGDPGGSRFDLDDITDKGWYDLGRVLADPREHDLETLYRLDILSPTQAHLGILEQLRPDDEQWSATLEIDFTTADTTPLLRRTAQYLHNAIHRVEDQATNPKDPDGVEAHVLPPLNRDASYYAKFHASHAASSAEGGPRGARSTADDEKAEGATKYLPTDDPIADIKALAEFSAHLRAARDSVWIGIKELAEQVGLELQRANTALERFKHENWDPAGSWDEIQRAEDNIVLDVLYRESLLTESLFKEALESISSARAAIDRVTDLETNTEQGSANPEENPLRGY